MEVERESDGVHSLCPIFNAFSRAEIMLGTVTGYQRTMICIDSTFSLCFAFC